MQTATLRYDKNILYTVNRPRITLELPGLNEYNKGMLFALLIDDLPETEPLRLLSQEEGTKSF